VHLDVGDITLDAYACGRAGFVPLDVACRIVARRVGRVEVEVEGELTGVRRADDELVVAMGVPGEHHVRGPARPDTCEEAEQIVGPAARDAGPEEFVGVAAPDEDGSRWSRSSGNHNGQRSRRRSSTGGINGAPLCRARKP
jgi:hypothetical protein